MAHDLNWLAAHWGCSVSDVVRRLLGHEIDILGLTNPELQSTRRRRSEDVLQAKPNGGKSNGKQNGNRQSDSTASESQVSAE